MTGERFELELLGEAVERRYRQARPEVEAMPWDSLALSSYSAEALVAARRAWTSAAFQEYRTAAACSTTLKALIECRAPLDLLAGFSRFPLDEIVHVELCARLATELGGGTELLLDPNNLTVEPDRNLSPLVRAADLVVRNFCVGEALSIPLLHGTWRNATHPLTRAVLGRIVRDEAAHGVFGFIFLDWALPMLSAHDVALLSRSGQEAISEVHKLWGDIRLRPRAPASEGHALGWMETEAYLALAARSMESRVIEPLRARGFDVTSGPLPSSSS